ncbi:hypothetical protein TSAR_016873 [Trichomalopsis sarcophagae]|uniref:Uncharacterized protein n=1 Tax=Trichomalopsis sarcophagae TaxID=543379 RepID=A0A232ENQ5_9HYME|nr:hypothetical protein TSAR_016873 [Trichomalopsis sarcophagae]
MERKGCVVELPQQPKLQQQRAASTSREFSASSATTRYSSDSVQAIDSKMSKHEQLDAGERKAANVDMQFPWMSEFRRLCSSSIMPGDSSALIKLMKFFKRNVSSNVNDCYKKSSRAVKLKELIKEALLLFVYFHRLEQPQDQNRAVYLEHMSDLLAMYIDLELVASKRDAEPQSSKISAKLVSCLFVYLEKSTEHVLDTLMKVQLMNETHCQILDVVISKTLRLIPANPETEVMYVRYLLVYRLWKKVHSNLAVRRQINASALASLGDRPDNLPATLLAEVLPSAATSAALSEAPTTRFYLCQQFDLRKACAKFVRICRRCRNAEEVDSSPAADDISERDQRLKSTITSETNIVEYVNNEFSKSSSLVDKTSSLKNVMNIPFAKLNINDGETPCSTGSSNLVKNSKTNNSAVPRKNKTLKEKLDEIAFIDLTEEEVTKIVKRKKRKGIDWLEDVKDARRLAALKIERDAGRKLKKQDFEQIFEVELKNASRRSSSESLDVELESKSYPNTEKNSESDSNLANEQTVDFSEPTNSKTKTISSPPISSPSSRLVGYDSDSVPEKCDLREKPIAEDDSSIDIEASDSAIVTSSKALTSEKEEEKVSALHDADVSLKDNNQPADSTVPNADAAKEKSSSKGEEPTQNSSVIREHAIAVAPVVVAEKAEPKKMIENQTVNFNSTKTDYYPSEQKVQQALTKERRSLSSINESHPPTEKPKDKKDYKNVTNEKVKAKRSPSQENRNTNTSAKRFEASSSEVPATSNGYYDIPESDIDGLTLLASVSAQQRISTSKKSEIKVKPYTSLQQKPKEENMKSVASHIVETYPEDSMGKVALQVEVSSSDAVSSTVIKQQQPDTSSEMLSYIIEETIQSNLESNDNANVILSGETVMLLQKSPNSNLYIINKAAVDNLSNSKINYNSDEEDSSKLAEYEDSKCCQQGISIKNDPDDVPQRVRGIKPDPDYADIKSGSLIGHDDPKLQNQSGYELHYAGYPVPPPGSYCAYPSIHHPSTGCACVSCAYCRPLPFYLPATHATQSVQTNSSVQEKRSKQKTDAAMMAKLYDEQMHSGKDKHLLDGKQQHQEQVGEAKQIISRYEHVDYYLPTAHATQTVQMNSAVQERRNNKVTDVVANLYDDQLITSSLEKNRLDGKHPEEMMEEKKEAVSKFEQLDSTLPLKKRLKAQRMSMHFGNREGGLPLKNKAVSSIYPGELMMSIADVDGQGNNSPLDLGAVIEVTSAMEKPVKSRVGRKEKTMNTNINNQNVPNCFPRKSSNKKKRVGSMDEEVENSGASAPKKSRKSKDDGAKQTRSSRRVVPTVNYVYPEVDTECNPSGKRKKKRTNRWSTTKAS